jgi:hypothetical protein
MKPVSPLVLILLGAAEKLFEKALELLEQPLTPTEKTFQHDGVTDAQLEELLRRAKDLPKT